MPDHGLQELQGERNEGEQMNEALKPGTVAIAYVPYLNEPSRGASTRC